MKKTYLLLLMAITAITATAQTVGEAFYIYRNDGGFNAFFRDEVQSIEYSHYDLDSIFYDEIVTQLVYTQDSLYRIPLAVIDSVGFVQPEIVLKQEVRSLTGSLLDYLVKYEGASLYFLTTIPSDLQPRVGDRLVTIEMTEMFPVGFFGEVISVTSEGGYVVVECGTLDIEDVFESYSYNVNITSDDGESANARSDNNPIDRHFSIPTLSHSWSIGGGYSIFTVSNTLGVSLTPRFHIRGNDIKDPVRGRQTDIRVTCNYTTGLNYEFGIEAALDPFDFPFPGGRGEEPIAPALSFFWDFGVFAAVSGSLTYSQSFTQEYVCHLDYKREGIKMPTINLDRPSLVGDQHSEPRIALKGSVRGGFYGEVGVKPWAVDKNLMGKVSGRLEIGVEAEMERGIDLGGLENADRNTALYDFVDHAADLTLPTLTISPYASVATTIAVGPWHFDPISWKGKIGSPLYQGGFFPHFSNTGYERTDGGIKFTSDLSRTCPFPWQIGYSVFDLNDNLIKTEYYGRSYREPLQFDTYDVTIGGLSKDGEYKVYPCINVFNHPVLASPYVTVKPCPVTLSDFKVTNKQYIEKGFTNDGMTYDYRFDVSVNATLDDDAENIADWGYVYLDPNGREAKISLRQFGTTYTDTRWAYYRNGTPPFTCTLYGYVQYVGSDELVYGEPHDYPLEYGETTCPDANHPHMIDLGLPSGTKWACCNVGASMPEGYGNYYAWGETSPKSVYNWDTYQYGYYNGDGDYSHLVNIGSDIAGTQYDAATANWGAPWRMPSLTQISELQDNCTSTWTTQNGVAGRKFTGPNGGTIFLPAAGYRRDGEFGYAGSYGNYWSSTLNESYPNYAYYLSFSSGYAYRYGYGRTYGYTVRPVRQN